MGPESKNTAFGFEFLFRPSISIMAMVNQLTLARITTIKMLMITMIMIIIIILLKN